MLFPEIVILSRIGSNFCNLFDVDLGIHFLPNLTKYLVTVRIWGPLQYV